MSEIPGSTPNAHHGAIGTATKINGQTSINHFAQTQNFLSLSPEQINALELTKAFEHDRPLAAADFQQLSETNRTIETPIPAIADQTSEADNLIIYPTLTKRETVPSAQAQGNTNRTNQDVHEDDDLTPSFLNRNTIEVENIADWYTKRNADEHDA